MNSPFKELLSIFKGDAKERKRMTLTLPEITAGENGTEWIAGTNTKVIEVVLNQKMGGFTSEEMAQQMPHLSLAQVVAALSFYEAHRTRLDAEIAARKAWIDKERTQTNSPSRAKLLARMKTVV